MATATRETHLARRAVTSERLPCIGIIEHFQLTAERFNDSLQAEANAEHRDTALRELAHQVRNAEISGPARSGRNRARCRDGSDQSCPSATFDRYVETDAPVWRA